MSESSQDIESLMKQAVEKATLKFDDARVLTEIERRHLARLMYFAFCELRVLSREGRNEQAEDLADAFHNVPLQMHREDFSFKAFRMFLENYQDKYPNKGRFNFLQEWEKLDTTVT